MRKIFTLLVLALLCAVGVFPSGATEMYAAYSNVLNDSHNFTHSLFDDFEDFVPVVDGGGLLDFDFDGIDDLVLIYRHNEIEYIKVCAVYSYKNGQTIELFSQALSDGGNWGYSSIVHKDGKGALCDYIYLYPEGNGPHVMGGGARYYNVFENGELVVKLGYYQNNYLSDFYQETADYQVWKVYRDGVEASSGTAPPDKSIPEIEALIAEAEAMFGDEWKPLSANELTELLR